MAANSGAIRAGRAFVELFADDSALQKGLKAAEKKLAAWGAGLQTIGARVAAIGVAGIAAAGSALNIFANIGSELSDLSDTTGIGIEALQEFGFAAQQAGSNMEQFTNGVARMQRLLVEAAGGSQQANRALEDVGLTLEDLSGLNPEQQFERIAAGITAIDGPAQRTAAAMAIFGRSGARLIPMMQSLAEERANARASGDIISASEARAAEQFGDKLSALGTSAKRTVFALGMELLPIAKQVIDWFQMAARATTAWIGENRGLVIGVGLGVAAVTALGVATWTLGLGVSVLSAAFGIVSGVIGIGYTAAVTVAKVATLLFTGGLALIPILVIGATVALVAAVGSWGNLFSGLADTARQTFGGITDAISAGDWAGAMEIAWVGIKLVWAQGIGFLADSWRGFRDSFVNVGDTAWVALKVGASETWAFLRSGWVEFGALIQRIWSNIGFFIAGIMSNALTVIQVGFADIVAMLPGPARTAARGLLGDIASPAAAAEAARRREQDLSERRARELGGTVQSRDAQGNRLFRDAQGNMLTEGQLVQRRLAGERGFTEVRENVQGNIEGNRQNALRDIAAERDATVNAERAGLEARINARRGARDAARAENQAEIADLQQQLDTLNSDAAIAAWEADLQRIYDRQFGGAAAAGGGGDLQRTLTGSVSSGFNAAAIRRFAGGLSPEAAAAQELVRRQQEANRLLQQLVEEARNRGVIFG